MNPFFATYQIFLCQPMHPRKKSIFVCFFLLAGKHRERENDANGATAGLPLFFERSLSETKRTARYLPRKYAFRSDYISFCVRQQLEMKKTSKIQKTDGRDILTERQRKEVCEADGKKKQGTAETGTCEKTAK